MMIMYHIRWLGQLLRGWLVHVLDIQVVIPRLFLVRISTLNHPFSGFPLTKIKAFRGEIKSTCCIPVHPIQHPMSFSTVHFLILSLRIWNTVQKALQMPPNLLTIPPS